MIEQVGKFVIDSNEYRPLSRVSKLYAAISIDSGDDTEWDQTYYLHSDGIIRRSIEHNGTFSGYFSTIEEVKQAIELYNKLNR